MGKVTITEVSVFLVIFVKTVNGFFDAPLSGSTNVYPWTIHKTNYKVKDHLLRDHVVTEFGSVRMLQLCARQCLTHDRCRSFNYFPAESRCELSNTTHVDAPDDFIKVIGAEYYLRSTFSIDKEALGGCGSRKCPSTGMCVEGCYGDKNSECVCFGDNSKTDKCEERGLPRWSEWSKWSPCTVSCGYGLHTRTRHCTDPGNNDAPLPDVNCGDTSEETRLCHVTPCPYWTPWSDWTNCSTHTTCGQGVKQQYRNCTYEGKIGVDGNCMGSPVQETLCHSPKCYGFFRLVGDEGTYGEGRVEVYDDITNTWGQICSHDWDEEDAFVFCRQHGFSNVSEVLTEVPEGDIPFLLTSVQCEGHEWTLQQCTHGGWGNNTCDDGKAVGVACSVDGVWGTWSEWGSCSVTCGNGTQLRHRNCSNPPAMRGGKDCEGISQEERGCFDFECAVWSPWGAWEECNVTCNGGLQRRERTCEGRVKDCVGSAEDWQTCNEENCAIPGDWMGWGEWGRCSVTCEGGWRVRKRMCDMNSYGDITAPCIGNSTQVGECNQHGCIVQNCADLVIKAADPLENGYYGIDPDLDGPNLPFVVYCDFTRDPSGETVIHHDSEKRTLVRDYEGAGEYQRVIHYANATLDQVGALVDISSHCEQFVKWECLQASINHPEKRLKLTYVVNRFEEQLNYFGDAPPNSGMCACGVTDTCAVPGTYCNCDANDKVWREDSGFITQLEDLPLSEFRAGDTGSINLDEEEEGYHTMGPLICSGFNTDYVLFRK